MPSGEVPPVAIDPWVVGVSTPVEVLMANPETFAVPLSATKRNCPFGVAVIPFGAEPAPVDTVAGFVGVNTAVLWLIVKAETVFVLVLDTNANCPLGETVIQDGAVPPVEKVCGEVGVNNPPAPMEKPDTSADPLFAT